MSRVLALDVGDRTIGIAMSDADRQIAFPGETIIRQPEGHRKDVATVARMARENEVGVVVIGLPLSLDGSTGPQAQKVIAFADVLRPSLEAPIEFQDERFSTSEAERMLISAGRRRDQRKKTIDSVAASVLLQTYLDRTASGPR